MPATSAVSTVCGGVVRATPRQLDDLADEFGVTRAWLVRRGLARGLPLLVAELREAYAQGLRVPPSRDGRAREGRRQRAALVDTLVLEPARRGARGGAPLRRPEDHQG